MNENKKRFVATALSLIFAMSVISTNVYAASSDSNPPGWAILPAIRLTECPAVPAAWAVTPRP